MKILKPFTGTGAIFFPEGKPPKGTCEKANDDCLKNCYVMQDYDFDEEVYLSREYKKKVYDMVIEAPVLDLITNIKNNLDGLQTPILHWFGSGDCLKKDQERISSLMSVIRNIPEIIQMGFTRNVTLWGRNKDILALTVEEKDLDSWVHQEGLFSVPNYKKQVSVMHSHTVKIRGGLCGPDFCKDIIDTKYKHPVNCKTCLRLKSGCFS